MHSYAAQLRELLEDSLVLCNLKTLRLYTGLFKFELDHYMTNVARVKCTYGILSILLEIGHMMCRSRCSRKYSEYIGHI